MTSNRGGTAGHLHEVLDGLGPREALRAVEREFPGWHLYLSDEGMVWAVTCTCPYGGCGMTLDARTPEGMWQEIAAEEHRWAAVA
jgi:hypothetical protein